MKKKDFVLIASVALVAVAALFLLPLWETRDVSRVIVTVDGAEALNVSLAQDGVYDIPQADGAVNVIKVADGGVRMVQANCRDGLCVQQGETRRAAKSIVCLPHRLVVRLAADEQEQDQTPLDGVDVVVR